MSDIAAAANARAVGRGAVLFELADGEHPIGAEAALQALQLDGVLETVPAARTLLVRFSPRVLQAHELVHAFAARDVGVRHEGSGIRHVIEVHYDGEDLDEVAQLLGTSREGVIERHTAADYLVAFTGFAPGFAYLEGGHPQLDVPRRSTPRTRIPGGSVALAGRRAGIYPRDSPGGWQLLGRTDAVLWEERRERAALLQPGDSVRFAASDREMVIAAAAPTPAPTTDAAGLVVVQPGLLALVQDLGRAGNAASGVSPSGALDRASAAAANHLVGNVPEAAVLELLGGNCRFRASEPLVVAVAGAPVELTVERANGRTTAYSQSQAMLLAEGDELVLGDVSDGVRNYLAIRGGLQSPLTLGSASSDLLSGLGPKPLRQGDVLTVGEHSRGSVQAPVPWRELTRLPDGTIDVPVVPGPRDDWFTDAAVQRFFATRWQVSRQSNRIGIRLEAEDGTTLDRTISAELASEGCVAGAIQVPADGKPLIFLADHPVTGGYPVIGVVDDRVLDTLGQVSEGETLRFRPIESSLNSGRSAS